MSQAVTFFQAPSIQTQKNKVTICTFSKWISLCKKGLQETKLVPAVIPNPFCWPCPLALTAPKDGPLCCQPEVECRQPQRGWCQSQMGFCPGPMPSGNKATGRQSYAKNFYGPYQEFWGNPRRADSGGDWAEGDLPFTCCAWFFCVLVSHSKSKSSLQLLKQSSLPSDHPYHPSHWFSWHLQSLWMFSSTCPIWLPRHFMD